MAPDLQNNKKKNKQERFFYRLISRLILRIRVNNIFKSRIKYLMTSQW